MCNARVKLAVVIGVLVAMAGAASASVVYDVQAPDLGFAVDGSGALAIDNQGRLVVYYYPTGESDYQLGLWTGSGSMTDMGWTNGDALDMVDGKVAGYYGFNSLRARYFEGDESQDIQDNLPGWTGSAASGVNSSGKVVGGFSKTPGDPEDIRYAFV